MTDKESALEKMRQNKAYPSNTPYFFGMTEAENNSLPYPYPPAEECDVTVSSEGTISFSRKPTGKPIRIQVSKELMAAPVLRKLGLSREQVRIKIVE